MSDITTSAVHQLLVCQICLGEYRNPRALPCLHSFCEQCLQGHAGADENSESESDDGDEYVAVTAGYMKCPVCRRPTRLPRGGVSALPANHLLVSLHDALSSACQKKEDAVSRTGRDDEASVKTEPDDKNVNCMYGMVFKNELADQLLKQRGTQMAEQTADNVMVSARNGHVDEVQGNEREFVDMPKAQAEKDILVGAFSVINPTDKLDRSLPTYQPNERPTSIKAEYMGISEKESPSYTISHASETTEQPPCSATTTGKELTKIHMGCTSLRDNLDQRLCRLGRMGERILSNENIGIAKREQPTSNTFLELMMKRYHCIDNVEPMRQMVGGLCEDNADIPPHETSYLACEMTVPTIKIVEELPSSPERGRVRVKQSPAKEGMSWKSELTMHLARRRWSISPDDDDRETNTNIPPRNKSACSFGDHRWISSQSGDESTVIKGRVAIHRSVSPFTSGIAAQPSKSYTVKDDTRTSLFIGDQISGGSAHEDTGISVEISRNTAQPVKVKSSYGSPTGESLIKTDECSLGVFTKKSGCNVTDECTCTGGFSSAFVKQQSRRAWRSRGGPDLNQNSAGGSEPNVRESEPKTASSEAEGVSRKSSLAKSETDSDVHKASDIAKKPAELKAKQHSRSSSAVRDVVAMMDKSEGVGLSKVGDYVSRDMCLVLKTAVRQLENVAVSAISNAGCVPRKLDDDPLHNTHTLIEDLKKKPDVMSHYKVPVYYDRPWTLLTLGRHGDGPVDFTMPCGVGLMPGGGVVVSDRCGGRVLVIDPCGDVMTTITCPGEVGGVCVTSASIFVAVNGSQCLAYEYTHDGRLLGEVGTQFGKVDVLGVSVLDLGDGRVKVVGASPHMHHVYTAGHTPRQFGGSGLLRFPSHVAAIRAVPPASDDQITIWVSDRNSLRKFTTDGELLADVDDRDLRPAGLCTDRDGYLMVADCSRRCVIRYTPGGRYLDTLAVLPPPLRPIDVTVGGGRLAVLVVGPGEAEVRIYPYSATVLKKERAN